MREDVSRHALICRKDGKVGQMGKGMLSLGEVVFPSPADVKLERLPKHFRHFAQLGCTAETQKRNARIGKAWRKPRWDHVES